jgi:DinB superfamily
MSDAFGGLEAAATQFEATKHEARALAGTLTDPQLNWRSAADAWSIGQCLQHLATSSDAVLDAIDRAITTARERAWRAPEPSRYGWFTRWMVSSMEPPPKRRMRTFGIFLPVDAALSREGLLDELSAARDRLLERTRSAAGLDLRRAVVVSPVTRLFRLPLGGYLAFLAAHDRRHVWQARRVRAAAGFPTA